MPASKIAIFGPPLAGKSTVLRAYARSRGLKTQAGHAQSATEGAAPHLLRTCKAEEHAQVATYSGAVWSIHDWDPLLRACDALLIVLDSQGERMDANLAHVQFLRRLRPNVRACFLLSKSDLPTSLPVEEIRRYLGLGDEPFVDWPIYESTDRASNTLLTPLDFLLERKK
jgi:signal recognition particle receptor subunit beta